jgi:hypothetical protein
VKVMKTIDEKVLGRFCRSRQGSVFSPSRFLDLGGRSAVGVALHRLAKASKIRRIRRGLYDLPRQHPIIGQTAPDIMATVRTLMDGSHAQWQFSGAYAANALGLSEQVPAKIVILTDGVPRRVPLGKLVLDFRRVAPRNLIGAGRRAGLVIQALRHLHGSPEMLQHVTRLKWDLDANTKKDLASLAPKLSAWIRPLAEEIARN